MLYACDKNVYDLLYLSRYLEIRQEIANILLTFAIGANILLTFAIGLE